MIDGPTPAHRTELHIDGVWGLPTSGTYLPAISPSSGQQIGEIAIGTAVEVERAVDAASRAARPWGESVTPFDRADYMRRIAEIVCTRRDELAHALTLDQGKPLWAEAYDEVDTLAEYFRMAAEDAVRLEGLIGSSREPGVQAFIQRRPLGVVGIITPWNWPYTMAAQVLAPALAAGNTAVWVPAPSTSYCSELMARCIVDAELPAGVFNFITGAGPVVGDSLAGAPELSALAFVGSTQTGRLVANRAATKKQLLELGSNGPIVILDDADLDLAVEGSLNGGMLCSGQSCTAAERVLVHEAIYDEFEKRLAAALPSLIVLGDPFDEKTTMGPLNNEPTAAKMDLHVSDALTRGARLVAGGRRRPELGSPLYWEPTILSDVPRDSIVATEETFGPILPLLKITSLEDAIALTNAQPEALVAAIYTNDLRAGLKFSRSVKAGGVNINLSSNYFEIHLPFGGGARSTSGTGRIGGRFGMEELTELQTVMVKL